jgi:tyrosyl-tRNA synthetase
MSKTCFEVLLANGFVDNSTSTDGELERLLEEETIHFYFGVDPTADGLTIGNYTVIKMAEILMEHGHYCHVVIGDLTAAIGDPSGKDQERPLLTRKQIADNEHMIKAEFNHLWKRFKNWSFISNTFIHQHNRNGHISMVDFLRDYGKHLTVSHMLNKLSVQNRLETGISFTEFSYQLIQGADFCALNQQRGVQLQIGGSDQYGNIVAGIELTRKINQERVYGITCPLLVKPNGKKFGKSSKGNIWLNEEKTSPWEMYQFFLGSDVDDSMLDNLARRLTHLDFSNPEVVERWKSYDPVTKRNEIARKVVLQVHGAKAIHNIELGKELLFTNRHEPKDFSYGDWGCLVNTIPNVIVGKVVDRDLSFLIKRHPMAPSRSELQRHLKVGAVKVNGRQLNGLDDEIKKDDLEFSQYAVLQIGKKNKIVLENNDKVYLA